ncbi:unnamed protein product [Clonostachys rosea]|uniref:Uncharacterized protein n=1 Tax=Bionectria ochroleuca TaxID=29856 RepID=A0ABY6V082_BIOOC|nr:unnamed protein product [Clonostachys rosea]
MDLKPILAKVVNNSKVTGITTQEFEGGGAAAAKLVQCKQHVARKVGAWEIAKKLSILVFGLKIKKMEKRWSAEGSWWVSGAADWQ